MTADDFDTRAFWRFCLEALKADLPVQQIITWIEPLSMTYNEIEGVCLLAPNRFILQWVKTRYLPRIEALAEEYGHDIKGITLKLATAAQSRSPLIPTAATPPLKPSMPPSPPVTEESRPSAPATTTENSPPPKRTKTFQLPASLTTLEETASTTAPTPPVASSDTEDKRSSNVVDDDPRQAVLPTTLAALPPAIMAWTPSHTTGQDANPADEFFALPPTNPTPSAQADRPYLIHDTDHLNIYNNAHHDIEALYDKTHLNPMLTFAALVRGRANDLAHAAARQVADSPGQTYNPLFIYGGVGLGKTHILQAVGNATFRENPGLIIRYIHANDYYSDVVKAYQQGSFEHFANYYRSLDILLIDDIQFFNNKTRTQEEFFHAFNALIEAKKQVIITCDTYPKEILGLSDRLISRFDWGLTVALEPPEPEMRVAILKKKAEIEGINLDEGVAFFIAKHLRSNVRELEGALNKVLAYARFHGKEAISIDITRRALEDLLSAHNRQITIELIQKTVADYYKIKVSDLFSKRRTINITRPRQIAMALARELTSMSLPTIGEAFGGRDHTTVLHACRHIAKLRTKDPQMNHDMHVLSQTLKG